MRGYHFGWGLGGAKSETHSQKKQEITQIRNPFTKKQEIIQ